MDFVFRDILNTQCDLQAKIKQQSPPTRTATKFPHFLGAFWGLLRGSVFTGCCVLRIVAILRNISINICWVFFVVGGFVVHCWYIVDSEAQKTQTIAIERGYKNPVLSRLKNRCGGCYCSALVICGQTFSAVRLWKVRFQERWVEPWTWKKMQSRTIVQQVSASGSLEIFEHKMLEEKRLMQKWKKNIKTRARMCRELCELLTKFWTPNTATLRHHKWILRARNPCIPKGKRRFPLRLSKEAHCFDTPNKTLHRTFELGFSVYQILDLSKCDVFIKLNEISDP